jgi:hypothetical protein
MENESASVVVKPQPRRGGTPAILLSVLFLSLALSLIGCAPQQLPFQVQGTRGQVGHHMTADIVLDDKAAGCSGPVGGAALVSGKSLPPGIHQNGQNDWYFEGTPTQAGQWRVPVTLIDLTCDGPRSDQTVTMEFDIAPQ